MLYILFLISFLNIHNSLAAASHEKNGFSICESLASAICCPLIQAGLNLSETAFLSTISRLGTNKISLTPDQECTAVVSIFLAPYAGRIVSKCLYGQYYRNDPCDPYCPGILDANCMPTISLACKGPMFAATLAAEFAIINYFPSYAKLYQLLPGLLKLDEEKTIMCVECQTLLATSCLSHYTTDCCCGHISEDDCCNCISKARCRSETYPINPEQKRD